MGQIAMKPSSINISLLLSTATNIMLTGSIYTVLNIFLSDNRIQLFKKIMKSFDASVIFPCYINIVELWPLLRVLRSKLHFFIILSIYLLCQLSNSLHEIQTLTNLRIFIYFSFLPELRRKIALHTKLKQYSTRSTLYFFGIYQNSTLINVIQRSLIM